MFLVVGVANAEKQNQEQNGLDTEVDNDDVENEEIDVDDDELMRQQKQIQERLIECLNEGEDCDMEQIQNQVRNQVQEMTSEQIMEQVKIKAEAKGVKIMPDTASERALEVLSAKFASMEIVEPTEVGETHRYRILAKKQAKFLGLFDTEMDVEAEIDAETGEVIKTRGPWWAFLTA